MHAAVRGRLGRDLLRLDIDRRVNLKPALGDAGRVFVFEISADLLDRIIPRGRFRLRLIVGRVGELDRLSLRGVDLGLRIFSGKYFAI